MRRRSAATSGEPSCSSHASSSSWRSEISGLAARMTSIGECSSPSMYWGKVATLKPRRRITSPPVNILRACENAKHCGLGSAVAADEPDPRPRLDPYPKTSQHGPASVELIYGTQPDEAHAGLLTLTRCVLLTG